MSVTSAATGGGVFGRAVNADTVEGEEESLDLLCFRHLKFAIPPQLRYQARLASARCQTRKKGFPLSLRLRIHNRAGCCSLRCWVQLRSIYWRIALLCLPPILRTPS